MYNCIGGCWTDGSRSTIVVVVCGDEDVFGLRTFSLIFLIAKGRVVLGMTVVLDTVITVDYVLCFSLSIRCKPLLVDEWVVIDDSTVSPDVN